jgi:hypothetical protein
MQFFGPPGGGIGKWRRFFPSVAEPTNERPLSGSRREFRRKNISFHGSLL